MEARDRPISDWMTKIPSRQIVLLRFQCMEAWGYWEITDLLNAVGCGVPVGSIRSRKALEASCCLDILVLARLLSCPRRM